MDYIDLDDNEFDNFLRSKAKRKRARRALLSGGASEIGRGARKNKRIARALLTGGASELKGMRALRKKCKAQLANARFSSRKARRRALKDCIMEAREHLMGGVSHTGVARPMPVRTARTKIGRAVSAMPAGAMGMFGRGR